jgi:hypothetical protein
MHFNRREGGVAAACVAAGAPGALVAALRPHVGLSL